MRSLLLSLLCAGSALAAPQRVVSLGGDLTEIAFALGRGGAIVAVDLTSVYPAEAQKLPRVGYVRALSAEGILAMKPDLILASGDAGPPEVLRQLERAGVPVVTLPKDHTLAGITAKIRAVAGALDAKSAGEKLAGAFDADCRTVEAASHAGRPLAAVFVMARGDGALSAAGSGTAADAMLAAAGLRNVFAGTEGYKPVSAEMLLDLAPAVLVTGTRTVQASGGLDRLKQNPALSLTPAVKADRVLVFDDMYLLGLGPRAARAARELAIAARR
ncbi:MAG: ABC transporter substrate-binding protein [Terrimicrobiaceae bacterium]|nr:ABC transporter substrate-binding protein [Terrimicrobiaceae bacterium]